MIEDTLSPQAIQEGLGTRYVGRNVLYSQIVASTQIVAARAAEEGAPEGTVAVADEQTRGRGRFDRAWVSPKGATLPVSIVLRPSSSLLPSIPMIAALAAAQAIERVAPALTPILKWPNDVLLKGRKVCGILVETAHAQGGPDYTIVGIGVNVNLDTTLYQEIARTATSLAMETGQDLSRRHLLHSLLEEFEALYEEAKAGGAVYAKWRGRLETLGRRVTVRGGLRGGEGLTGTAEDAAPDGALLLRTDGGDLHTLYAGDVTVVS